PQRVSSLLQVADLTRGAPAYWAGIDERKDATLIVHMPSVALQKAQLDQSELTLRLFDDHEARKRLDFEESWRAFLHAWNLLQFHPNGVDACSGESLVRLGEEDSAELVNADGSLRSGALSAGPRSLVDQSSAPPSTRSSRSSTGSSKAPDDAYSAFAKEYEIGR